MTIHCPCCGSPMNADAASVKALEVLPLPPAPRAILSMMAASYPKPISMDDMVIRVYRGVGPNAPDDQVGAMRNRLSRLRSQLRKYGWTISPAHMSRGDALYRLERLS